MNRHGMDDFSEYQGKPVTRLAYQLRPEDVVAKVAEATYRIVLPQAGITDFKAYEPPQAGDYIVYLNEDDIYHCDAEVFRARNVVED